MMAKGKIHEKQSLQKTIGTNQNARHVNAQ